MHEFFSQNYKEYLYTIMENAWKETDHYSPHAIPILHYKY